MVKLNKIYTRTGDTGLTRLVNGLRCSKDNIRFDVCGGIDETNAAIGLARLHATQMKMLDNTLERIQNELFDLGADFATPVDPEDITKKNPLALRIIPAQVKKIEQDIDTMNRQLMPLSSFILPGGNPAAAFLHLARTIARRTERSVVTLSQKDVINPTALHYTNRLSDFLFVAARFANCREEEDILWIPGKSR